VAERHGHTHATVTLNQYDQGLGAESNLRSDRLVSVSQVEGRPVIAVEALEDLDPVDRVWLEERLVEYEDLLLYLHDH
jgi:hypothetical protein